MKMKRKPYSIVTLTEEEKKKLLDASYILEKVLEDTKDRQTDLAFNEGSIISTIHIVSDMILRNIPREEED